MPDGRNIIEAEWSTAFVNDLPDASFAIILPGGEKDEEDKTTPRGLRKLPYKDADGVVDVPHLRNALARLSQVEGASDAAMAAAKAELDAAAEEYLKGEPEAETPEEAAPETPPNPTPDDDATAVATVEPAAEQDALVQLRDHLQAALEILSDMIAPDEEPEPEAPTEAAETFAEVAAVALVEATPPANRRAPLRLDVGIIKVGPGNERDRHYYTGEMLERDGGVFAGSKMYATDHRNDEKSVRTEVSLIEKVLGVKEFADGRYLVGRAVVFNPDFAEDVRNRADAGVLDSLHCSILAKGEAKPGKVGETEYNIVQRIVEAQSVDWVTRAGAGGHALQLTESAADPEPEPEAETPALSEEAAQIVTLSEDRQTVTEGVIQPLAVADVLAELGQTNLPAASVATLATASYTDKQVLQAAVAAEVARLKAAGSGKPLGMGASLQQAAPKSLTEIQAELQAVNRKWIGG